MAKAAGRKAASGSEPEKKRRKPAATKAVATRTKPKPAATKAVATRTRPKSPAKKVAARKKPAGAKAKAPAGKKKVATTVKSKRRTTAARSRKVVVKKQAPQTRRVRAAVLEVSPAVIDTSSAAEVAARMVADHTAGAAADPFGLIFTPPPPVVKRGSSALRHVKEQLHKPVAAQLASVFGPAPVPPQAMKRFLRGEKVARSNRVRGSTSFHAGPPTVPHRSVG
jgi:hypothetical protein